LLSNGLLYDSYTSQFVRLTYAKLAKVDLLILGDWGINVITKEGWKKAKDKSQKKKNRHSGVKKNFR